MISADIAVIGGGIAGVSAAGELAAHRSIILLEQEDQLAYHTTGRSAAAFLETYGGPEVRALARASRPVVEAAGELLAPRPMVYLAHGDRRAELEALLAEVRGLRPINAAEALRLCPALRPGYVTAAALDHNAQDIDVHGLHQHFLRAARRNGAQVLTGAAVTAGERSGDGWTLRTARGDVRAHIVVNAAGAWADQVADRLGVAPVGLTPLRRTAAVALAARVDPAWPLVVEVTEEFYFRPEGDGVLLSPADETPSEPCDARPEEIDVALAIERVNAATTLGIRSIKTAWAGLRTFAVDRVPVVGFDSDVPGFFWLAGQGGYGIKTACGLAMLTAGLITDGRAPDRLAELDPGRLSPARFR